MVYDVIVWLGAPILLALAIRFARQRRLSWRSGWFWGFGAAGLIIWAIWSRFWAGIPIAIWIGAGAFLFEQWHRADAEEWRAAIGSDTDPIGGTDSSRSRQWLNRYAIVIVVLIVAVPIASYVAFYHSLGKCHIVAEQRSPDGDYRAVMTNRFCDNYGMDDIDPNDWSEIYLIDERQRWRPLMYRKDYVSGFSDERFPMISMRWTADRSLMIEVTDTRPEQQEPDSEWVTGDVTVSIRRQPP